MSADASLQRLVAFAALAELKANYCLCVDTKEWAGFASLFTADLVVDGTDAEPIVGGAEYAALVAAKHAETSTAHHVHSPILERSTPDLASGVWAMADDNVYPPGHAAIESGHRRRLGYGHYQEQYRREDGVWRISRLRLLRLRVWWTSDLGDAEGLIAMRSIGAEPSLYKRASR
jgi:SnoaL-like domain